MYTIIIQKNEEKDIFDVFDSSFGSWIGKIFSFIFVTFCIFIAIVTTKSIIIFIKDINFKSTPYFYILIFFIGLYIFCLYKGIEVNARLSCVLYVLFILMVLTSFILVIERIEPFHMKPFIAAPTKDIIKGGFYNYAIIFGDSVIILGLVISSKNKKNKKTSVFKSLLIANGISSITNALAIIFSILVLGFPLYNHLYYPVPYAISTVSIAMFISRIEVIVSIIFLNAAIIKSIIAMYVATKGMQKVFSTKDNRTFIIPVSIIVFIGSLILFDEINEIIKFDNYYGWVKVIIQAGIPILLAIFVLFKKKKKEST